MQSQRKGRCKLYLTEKLSFPAPLTSTWWTRCHQFLDCRLHQISSAIFAGELPEETSEDALLKIFSEATNISVFSTTWLPLRSPTEWAAGELASAQEQALARNCLFFLNHVYYSGCNEDFPSYLWVVGVKDADESTSFNAQNWPIKKSVSNLKWTRALFLTSVQL